MIIGLVGLIGSGKGTVGDYLRDEHMFRQVSFAGTLKDVTASLFQWDRKLLEGDTSESREFRETVDSFWTSKFGYNVTPRYMLQILGTDVMRNHLDTNIWLWALERQLKSGFNYVITDTRFPNELQFISELGGKSLRIVRGAVPEWDSFARLQNSGAHNTIMQRTYPGIHYSEWALAGYSTDYEIHNNDTLDILYRKVDETLSLTNT